MTYFILGQSFCIFLYAKQHKPVVIHQFCASSLLRVWAGAPEGVLSYFSSRVPVRKWAFLDDAGILPQVGDTGYRCSVHDGRSR